MADPFLSSIIPTFDTILLHTHVQIKYRRDSEADS